MKVKVHIKRHHLRDVGTVHNKTIVEVLLFMIYRIFITIIDRRFYKRSCQSPFCLLAASGVVLNSKRNTMPDFRLG